MDVVSCFEAVMAATSPTPFMGASAVDANKNGFE